MPFTIQSTTSPKHIRHTQNYLKQAVPRFGAVDLRGDQMDLPALTLPPRPNKLILWIAKCYVQWHLRFNERIAHIHIQGAEQIRKALQEKKHVILAPNHPGFGDVYMVPLISVASKQPGAVMGQVGLFHAIRSPRLAKKYGQPIMNWLLSHFGLFPVHSDVKDHGAMKASIDVVKEGKYPLIIFPEGHYSWQNDQVSEMQYGTVALGLKAASELKKQYQQGNMKQLEDVVIFPIGIKHRFQRPSLKQLQKIIDNLETQLSISVHKKGIEPTLENLTPRVEALWMKVLEKEYLKMLQQEGLPQNLLKTLPNDLSERHLQVTEALIGSVEKSFGLAAEKDTSFALRIKNIRHFYRSQRIQPGGMPEGVKKRFDQIYKPRLNTAYEFQKFSTDYLSSHVTQERLAETLFKLDFILTQNESSMMADIGPRKTKIQVGAPISLTSLLPGYESQKQETIRALTQHLRSSLQSLVSSL